MHFWIDKRSGCGGGGGYGGRRMPLVAGGGVSGPQRRRRRARKPPMAAALAAAAAPVHRCPAAAAHHLQMRPCRRGALRQLHACQPPGCSVGGGGGAGAGAGSLALELDGVLLGLPPESPSAEGGLPAEEKKCRLWTACIIAAMFVFGAKFYLGPQKYRVPVQQSMNGEDDQTILANRTILEVVILGAMFCFVASLLLFGCLSLCRAHARVLLAAAVSSSQPQPPAPLVPLRPPLASGAFSLPPPPLSHSVTPTAPHEDTDLDTSTYMSLAASGHTAAATAAFSDVPEVSVVPPEPPPPPYHVAIMLPTQCDEVPPPSYDKAVS